MTSEDSTWVNSPAGAWTAVDMSHAQSGENFVSGDTTGRRLVVRYFRTDTGALRAKVLLGPGAQGPPGHAHGGSIAALLDEAMGGASWIQGHTAVAAELTVRFKTMLPLGTRCIVESAVDSVEGRKVSTSAMLLDEAGTIYAEASGLFITLPAERFGAGSPPTSG